jgi:hypothetical protein
METLLNIVLFLVISGVMFAGAYFLLNRFDPVMGERIRSTIKGLIEKFKAK